MAVVDDRVVSMAFENSKFESGVKTSMSSLDKLKSMLTFKGVEKGFDNINAASKKTDLSHIGRGVEAVSSRLSALRLVAIGVLSNIATKAIQAGTQFVKGFTFGPITDGLAEYENQLNSIQTILANTQAAGTNLNDVNKALKELNDYADLTIYNFGQMTKNIGTFTAAGVDLETATTSIKGIANIAALSGSSAEQAATAMYQLSQAISSGRVSLQDWNSVVNAGMGGSVFQRALAQTAVAMGELDESAVSLEGKMKNVKIEGQSFRESIMAAPGEQSWLSKEVLTGTLKQFSGDMTDAQLKAQGFNEEQIKAIKLQAKMAVDAATKVKTFTQLIDTTKEAIGSGWAGTFQILLGDFGEAKKLFTGLADVIGGFVGESADARNKVLQDWKDLGGRTVLLEALGNAFKALVEFIKPIKDAFRDIFPRKTGEDLLALTSSFHKFTRSLMPGPETIENLRRTFRGFFAILDIGKAILGGIWAAIKQLLGAVGDGSGGVLEFTGNVGDLIVEFRNWLREGEKIKSFFEALGSVLAVPIRLIGALAGGLAALFSSGDSGTGDSLAGMAGGLEQAGEAASVAERAFSAFSRIIERIGDILGPIADRIGEAFSGLPDAIGNALSSANYDSVFKILQTTLIGGIFLAIKKAIGGGLSFDFGGGVLSNLTGSLDALNGSLKAIQTNIKANTLLQIGVAVLALAGAVTMLSKINPDKLASAMTAVTVGLGQLMGAMAVLAKIGGTVGFLKTPVIAGSLILLATAMNILALAMYGISRLDWGEIAKGLTGIGGLLLILSVATKPLSAAGPGMIAAGIAISALAIGLNILGLALKVFATMSWEKMAQGLLGVSAALVAIGLSTKLIGPQILLVGPGLIAVGIALTAIGAAVKIFASMDLAQLGKGILGIGTALATIGLAVGLMPPTLPLTAAGLILVGIALNSIAIAIGIMGGMDIGTLAKGIGGIAAALIVLAAGLTAMIASLPGAVALLAAAGALAILVPVIGILGTMSWGTILKGLGSMVLSIIALGVAGTLAAPGLIALGVALTVMGAGMTLVSAAVYLLVQGLVKLAGEGAKGIGVTIAAFTAFIAILPKIIIDFLKGLVEIVAQIAKIAPAIVDSLAKIIISLLDVVIKAAPKMAKAAIAIIGAFLKVLRQKIPEFIKTGIVIFLSLLKGIEKNIGRITKTVGNIVINFLKALTSKLSELINAGAEFLAALLEGIADNLDDVVDAAFDVVVKFVKAIAKNLPKVVKAGLDIPLRLIKGISNKFTEIIKTGGEAIAKFLKGVANTGRKIIKAGVEAATKFINAVSKELPKLADKGATAIIRFMNRMAEVIRRRTPELVDAFFNMGTALIQGLIDGITDKLPDIKGKLDELGDLVKSLPSKAWKLLSPSKVFHGYGENIVQGLINGIDKNTPRAGASSARMAKEVIGSFSQAAVQLTGEQNAILGELGKELSTVFWHPMLGIPQDLDQVQQAFADMLDRIESRLAESDERISVLTERRDAAVDIIEKKRERRKKLRKGKENKAQRKELKDIKKLLERQNQVVASSNEALDKEAELRARLIAGKTDLVSGLSAEKEQLRGLVVEFNDVSQKLLDAEQNLADAKQARIEAAASIRDQFMGLPDVIYEDINQVKTDPLKGYLNSLSAQVKATKKYRETLDRLRAAGLDDATYRKLLDEGVGGQAFADSILRGGQTAINSINYLDKQLLDESTRLGNNAAAKFHDAGVNAAQGLVDGLKSKQSQIYTTMIGIANAMVKAIKKKLKIKSPSEAFAEMGKFSMEGMAQGLYKSSKKVTDAVTGVSKDALSAMKSKMKMVSDAVADQIDPNPTITPVLDLTDIQNGSKSLQDMMNVVPISAAASYGQARSISAGELSAKLAQQEELARLAGINYIQNNYSPEALSAIEIYRRTRNQLAQARPVQS